MSEQELKDILDKHDKWLKSEDGGEKANLSNCDLRFADLRSANLSYANLSYADLSSANLSYANLSYADLSSANLSYADLSSANLSSADLRSANLMIFQMQRHQAFYTFDGTLRIGCEVMPITEWALGFKQIGKANGYTGEQIEAYGDFVMMCLKHFKRG
ncbi:MAG: pentapeptide repeat-containing protein [Pseudanabaena sp. M151S2SP2A07QC]|nr:pentapeptide repeat-containing protein [Pseudanabaena sp. M151S2SP2A07QC]